MCGSRVASLSGITGLEGRKQSAPQSRLGDDVFEDVKMDGKNCWRCER